MEILNEESKPNRYLMDELLDVTVLPDFKEGDVITFDKGNIEELHSMAHILIDTFDLYKPILSTDEKYLKDRVQHGKVTGLQLHELEIVEFGQHDLEVNRVPKQLLGWEACIKGEMHYPGYGKVSLNFPFMVLQADKYYRYGPYNIDKKTISHIKDPEIIRALNASKNLGSFASRGVSRKNPSKAATKVSSTE